MPIKYTYIIIYKEILSRDLVKDQNDFNDLDLISMKTHLSAFFEERIDILITSPLN